MSTTESGRVVPILKSVFLHGILVVLLGWSWWRWRAQPAPVVPTLAIEATVVMSRPATVAPAATTTTAAPIPPPVAPPVPDPAAIQRANEQQRAERAERAAADKAAAAKEAAERLKAEQAAAASAAAAKAVAAKAAADKLLAQQLARDAAEKQRRVAELRASLAAEERANAARANGEQAAYAALIRARIEQAWKRPPGTRAGLNCVVHVTQVPGGVVTAVNIGSCNGDGVVRQSIEDAVYGASPLPVPSNAELFERDLVFNFKPDD